MDVCVGGWGGWICLKNRGVLVAKLVKLET